MHFKNKFQFNCISFNFSLDRPTSQRQSFIFWSSIHCAHTFVINKMFDRLNGTNQFLCPQCQLSAAHWLPRFCRTVFSKHDSFLHRQLQTDGQTGAHLQGFFCLHETQLPSNWQWQMMAHIHHKQQPFGCVSAVAECSSVSKKFYNCTIADLVKISHNVQPAFFNTLNIAK